MEFLLRFYLTIIIFCLVQMDMYGQNINKPITIDSSSNDSMVLIWLNNLYEEGVKVVNDSVIMNAESTRLLNDESYRQIIYPKIYSWEVALEYIQRQELKKAFWFFLNLYADDEKNKELVIKSLLTYDKLFKMDKILVNTFYTYILTDPQIGTIVDGYSKVSAPHIMEKKLNALKEILFYLDKYKPEDRID